VLGLIVWFLVFHTTNTLTILLPYMYGIVLVSIVVSGGEYIYLGLEIVRKHPH
jgi:hypothetical protein